MINRNYRNELSKRQRQLFRLVQPLETFRELAIARLARNGGLPDEKLPLPTSSLACERGTRGARWCARATRNGNDSMNSANTALSRPTGGGSRVFERDKLTLLAAPPP